VKTSNLETNISSGIFQHSRFVQEKLKEGVTSTFAAYEFLGCSAV
jgi:hypothetical protein